MATRKLKYHGSAAEDAWRNGYHKPSNNDAAQYIPGPIQEQMLEMIHDDVDVPAIAAKFGAKASSVLQLVDHGTIFTRGCRTYKCETCGGRCNAKPCLLCYTRKSMGVKS